jgi:hypothetical protein
MEAIKILTLVFFVSMSSKSKAECEVTSLKDSYGHQISYYHNAESPDFAVMILPPTGGENFTDRSLAKSLCERGLSAYIFNYEQLEADLKDLGTHDEISRITFRWVDDFLATRPEKNWGVVGSSLGGMYASMILGIAKGASVPDSYPNFQKVQAAALIVAGGSLAEVLATSQQEGVVRQREFRLDHFGVSSVADYQSMLEEKIQYDPLDLAVAAESDNVLTFLTDSDDVVPSRTQTHLWQAWGQPARIDYSTGHSVTIGRAYLFSASRIAEFFQARRSALN